jgi:uncharacterized protein YcaQ
MSRRAETLAESEPNLERLSRSEAQALATIASRLDRRPRPSRDPAVQKARLHDSIRHLGCVQLDTISVVSRAHETALWSRLGAYDPALLSSLHYPDGLLTEYWAHAAAIIPIESFPYYRHGMRRYREKYEQPDSWAARNVETIEAVQQRIREDGAMAARLFERPDGPRPEAWEWYGGKPARQALDHLWSRGDLMVTRRESGFQRVYDLTERVISADLFGHEPSESERRRHFVGGALRALGVATPRWVADYYRTWAQAHNTPKASQTGLEELAAEGLAVPVQVEGIAEATWLDAALLPRLAELRAGKGKPALTTLLSPFDNLVWYRARDEALWDFHYRIEVYTPAPKRVYGYYSMPILHKGKLVGRLDPVVDRKARILTVRRVHLEPAVKPSEPLAAAIAGALWDFAGFLKAEEVLLLAANPEPFTPMLADALSRPGN